MTVARRRRAQRRGRWAEHLCALHLALRGYRIVGRRLRTPVGEIDILARRGAVLAIVEVKRRETHAAAAEALSARQRARLVRAAAWLVARRPELAALDLRFDLMLVVPGRPPRHIVDAWRAGEH